MARRSRTTDPSGAPYHWESYATRTARVVENELDDALQGGCRTQAEYELFKEAVLERLDRAAQGGLGVDDEPAPSPVRSQPSLWELRWSFADDRNLRLYHGEPDGSPDLLLALKYHWKRLKGLSPAEIESAQDAEMADAAARFRSSSWYSTSDE